MRNSRWLCFDVFIRAELLYTAGHISVLGERGAPPKNQIECKNRINSSYKAWELCSTVAWLSFFTIFFFVFVFVFFFFVYFCTLSFFKFFYCLIPCFFSTFTFSFIFFFINFCNWCVFLLRYLFFAHSPHHHVWLHLTKMKRGRSPPISFLILLVGRFCIFSSFRM